MYQRPRRNRKSEAVRAMIRETIVMPADLIQPLFITDGTGIKKSLTSLVGQYIWSLDTLLSEIENCINVGLNSFMLFPKVQDQLKDKLGSYSYSDENFYLKAAKRIKQEFPDACLISDVALDPYNIDGHDGIVRDGRILNDETLAVLARMSVAQAAAGFDILGPSDMMDGRVGAIREALDASDFKDCSIMSYTAKYASGLYGPFRDALESAPVESTDVPKNKRTYQMDPANKREALIEAELDELEGADFLMVKPALHYLDIIHLLKENTALPIAAYHVSGECAMLLAAAEKGWLNYEEVMPEVLLSIKRAGADVIISYFAKDFCKSLL